MCHTDVVAPIVTNRFPYFRRTSSFFDENRETDWLQWELQRRYDTSP